MLSYSLADNIDKVTNTKNGHIGLTFIKRYNMNPISMDKSKFSGRLTDCRHRY